MRRYPPRVDIDSIVSTLTPNVRGDGGAGIIIVNRGDLVNYSEDRAFDQAAYHGSPHIFDRFSLDHIGSGEGAQAYGWGLYFAGSKAVAKSWPSR
jgi:hypothetical protein